MVRNPRNQHQKEEKTKGANQIKMSVAGEKARKRESDCLQESRNFS
jgi:hypothetical protein